MKTVLDEQMSQGASPSALSSSSSETREYLFQLAIGYMPAVALNVVARLNIADLLRTGPKSIASLSQDSGCHENVLYRILRALASLDVFSEIDDRKFALTPLAELLRTDHPNSIRATVLFMGNQLHMRTFAELMHTVKTGKTAVEYAIGKSFFEYLKEAEEDSQAFNDAMTIATANVVPSILESYDFSNIETLVDVGGGHGLLLASILHLYPALQGVLFDVDHVITGALPRLKQLGLGSRCRCVAGDFFMPPLPSGDAYIMKHVIHDWDDHRALQILKSCHSALSDKRQGKIILCEFVISPGNQPNISKWIDIEMLMLPGGRERTEEEFTQLLRHAGFRLSRLIHMKSSMCLIEAKWEPS
jgi:hypothetical protein